MSPSRKREPTRLRLVSKGAEEAPASDSRSVSDEELIAAIRRGEKSAAVHFHDRVRPQIDRTLVRLFGRRDVDHEDLRQSALIELVSSLHRYRGDCSLDGWVGAVTAHLVYKHLRRRQTERRVFSLIEREDFITPQPSSSPREPLVRDLMRHASRHLENMDLNRAWAFLLHDVLGYDLRELAVATGVSVAAAQSRLSRARRELHDRFAADPELAGLLDTLGGDWP